MLIIMFRFAIVCILASCGPVGPVNTAGRVVIDCLAADQGRLEALVLSLSREVATGAPDWGAIGQAAVQAGQAIGGCALAHVVQTYLTPPSGRKAPQEDQGREARATLEWFRAEHAGGAVFRSREGDL